VRALLDTHALLWWLVADERLSERARETIADPRSELYLSAASSWEIAIKVRLGRLRLPRPPRSLIPAVLAEQRIRPLEISHSHALATADLPPLHRDPFDRLLAAQARMEKLVIVSSDPVFGRYGVRTVW